MSIFFWISQSLDIKQKCMSVSDYFNQYFGTLANHANVLPVLKTGDQVRP